MQPAKSAMLKNANQGLSSTLVQMFLSEIFAYGFLPRPPGLAFLCAFDAAAQQKPPQSGVSRKDKKGTRPPAIDVLRYFNVLTSCFAQRQINKATERTPLEFGHPCEPQDCGRLGPDLLIADVSHCRCRWGQ